MKLWQSRKAMQTETPTESSPAPQHKQSRFSHLGIRWRLVGSFAMFVALLLMLLWLLQIVFLESFYKSIKTSSIKNTAEEVAASINDENFYTEVNRLTRQDLICVHIVREDGTPVLTSGNQPSCILHMLLTDQAALLFRQAQENGGTVLENYQLLELSPAMQSKATAQAASTEQLLYGILTTRGEDEGAEPVMVMVDATITPINTTVETLRAQLVIITVIIPPQTISSSLYLHFNFFDIFGIFKATTGSSLNLRGSPIPYALMSATCMGLKNGLYIYMIRQFFTGIPKSLEEAAYVDGCSIFKTFWRVILPDAVPILVSCFLFSFVWQWTDTFYSKLFLGNIKLLSLEASTVADRLNSYVSIQLGLSGGASMGYQQQMVSTATLMLVAPLLVLYLFAQRSFVESIAASGIKG